MINNNEKPTILRRLRQLAPKRAFRPSEALVLAEKQAALANDLLEARHGPATRFGSVADVSCFEAMPRLQVVYDDLPVSGLSFWNGRSWIVALNGEDGLCRQRFTLLHEFKHIIDHHSSHLLYGTGPLGRARAEQAADYFAGCVLVPKTKLKSAWCSGIQQIDALAETFDVSQTAIRVRLAQTGLDRPSDQQRPLSRCARPIRTDHPWQPPVFRLASTTYPASGISRKRYAT